MVVTISRDELKKKVDRREKFALVDVLAPESFQRGHLPGAINIPMDRVKDLAPGLLPDKNAEVVTYCMNKLWTASETVARDLAAMGYKNVREYAEGKQDWLDAGLPVEGAGSAGPRR